MDDAVGTLISETALVKAEKAEVADIREESSLAQIIMRAARDPQIDVEKMERLLAMHERITAEQRQTAFMAALAAVAPKLPPILKKGRIVIPGQPARKYALLEDIDRAIRPIISTEGFSLSFDTQPAEGGKIRVICRLSHRAGHSEVKQLDLPVDKSGSKNDAQAIVSTVSYGRRTLTKMFFNLIEAGEDDDGMGGSKPITRISPGPLACGSSRPMRKITPRSYSERILMEESR